MNNRFMLLMIGVVVFCMGVLLFLNIAPMIWTPQTEKYIKYNDVRGMAVEHKNRLFTLNFDQQVKAIGFLNQSVPARDTNQDSKPKLEISKIVIYRFGLPDITLVPIEYRENNLLFSSPEWNGNGLLKDVSKGEFKNLLLQTYDP